MDSEIQLSGRCTNLVMSEVSILMSETISRTTRFLALCQGAGPLAQSSCYGSRRPRTRWFRLLILVPSISSAAPVRRRHPPGRPLVPPPPLLPTPGLRRGRLRRGAVDSRWRAAPEPSSDESHEDQSVNATRISFFYIIKLLRTEIWVGSSDRESFDFTG
jgi:hypothetical protein